jgi:hypothetical protein
MVRTMKRLAWTGAAIAVVLGVLLALVDRTALGAAPADDRLLRMQQSPQWHGDRFENR